jgi:hypothetical protein
MLMRCIEVLLARDIMEDPERRKLEDALDVKADRRRASISPARALYKMDDWCPVVRYTAGISQTVEETR